MTPTRQETSEMTAPDQKRRQLLQGIGAGLAPAGPGRRARHHRRRGRARDA